MIFIVLGAFVCIRKRRKHEALLKKITLKDIEGTILYKINSQISVQDKLGESPVSDNAKLRFQLKYSQKISKDYGKDLSRFF